MRLHVPEQPASIRMEAVLRMGGASEPLPLGRRPTPLEQRDDIGAALGLRTFLKREDLADDIGCGHKLRKLGFVLADALAQKSDVLITAGSLPSNQCKAVAALSRRVGLRAHIVYGGDRQRRPERANGNYLITTLCEPTISWFETTPWSHMPTALSTVAAAEARDGARPYVIEPGVSAWPGLLGSVDLGFEIAAQLALRDVTQCEFVAVAGSGGTCAGLAIAASLMHKPWSVTGICIGEPPEALTRRADAFVADFSRRTGLSVTTRDILSFSDLAIGDGYDAATPRECEAISTALQQYGLMLDSNYMIKAYLGMFALRQAGKLKAPAVVLLHSGGQAGLFDPGDRWQDWYRTRHANAVTR
jgi:1-aminocyclopropane-1-carboxylate deaminase/D-cysteine desulfhydrase-like pyridoxal-dependent ACC family enzyme